MSNAIDEAMKVIESHPLDCKCDVCIAFVTSRTGAAGLLAAAAAIEKAANDG